MSTVILAEYGVATTIPFSLFEVDGVEYPFGGDVILAVDGKIVRQIDDILIHLQRYKSVGDEMVLEVLRDGRVTNFVVELDERPNSG